MSLPSAVSDGISEILTVSSNNCEKNELAAFYRDASIAMVTPLRDGMNLVAKEFVACQIEEPGVLILSPFAGAGETMLEAIVINPYKIDEVAELIHDALQMPRDEREVRMKHLRRREKYSRIPRLFFFLFFFSVSFCFFSSLLLQLC